MGQKRGQKLNRHRVTKGAQARQRASLPSAQRFNRQL